MEGPRNRNDVLLIIGVIVLLIGLAALGQTLNLFPPFLWELLRAAARSAGPLAVIVLGVFVIVAATRGGLRPTMPPPGTRLERVRKGRVVWGVAGGLAKYFGIDPTFVRLGFILLVFAGFGSALLVYIVLAIVMPEEPAAEEAPPHA